MVGAKHNNRWVENMNKVNYFTRNPQQVEEYYYEKDVYVVNYQRGVFHQFTKDPTRIIGANVNETKVGTMEITTKRANV